MSDAYEEPPKKKRTWLWVILGVLAFFIVTGLGMAAVTVYWLGNHMEIVETPAPDAVKSFDEVRAKFPGQRPLLEFKDGEPQGLNTDRPAAAEGKLTTLHVIAFDDNEGRLVRVDVPFWLLRLKSGPIAFSSYASGFDDRRVKLSVEDIERRGPGIVLDLDRPNEGRVLIWAE